MSIDSAPHDNISFGDNAAVTGDVFTGGKVVNNVRGDYFANVQNYHERRRPPVPRQAPALPRYFVPRPEHSQLCAALTGQPQVVALTGLNGVGKTTLASAAAGATQAHFAEGVLWGQFHGRPGEAREVLGDFLAALDVDTDQFRTLEQRVGVLRSALSGRRLLLVLDNWAETELAPEALLPADGAASLLLTTPDRDLATQAAARVVDLPPLPDDGARELLGKIAGPELLALPASTLDRMLSQTGRVPVMLVAVAQQARQLRRQGPEALLAWAANPSIRWDDLATLFEFTFHQLSPAELRVVQALALLAAAPLDDRLVAAALGVEAGAARASLAELEARSLLQAAPGGGFVVPAPVHGYARQRLAADPEAAALRARLVDHCARRDDEDPDPGRAALLQPHVRALFEQCLQAEEWPAVRALAQHGPRPIQVDGGSLSSIFHSDLFSSQFNSVTCGHSVLADADLSGAQWNHCEFSRATLGLVKLAGSQFNNCQFALTRWVGADARAAQFNNCDFGDLHLVNVDLRGAELNNCTFANSLCLNVQVGGTTFNNCAGLDFLLPPAAAPPSPPEGAR